MTFLVATMLCMIVPLVFLVVVMRTDRKDSRITVRFAFLAAIVGWALSLAAVLGMVWPAEAKMNDTNWAPVLFLAAAAAGVLVYGYHAFIMLKTASGAQAGKGWVGAWILATCASAYVTYAAGDHVLFWHDKGNVGIASNLLFEGTDIHCDSQLILVKRDGDAFIYRCPHNVVFGNPYGQPFVPWPSYSEGRSVQLVDAYNKMLNDARNAMPDDARTATASQ